MIPIYERMKKSIWTTLHLLLLFFVTSAQNPCQSLRYKEPVFSDTILIKDLKFATADPYGILDNQDLLLDIYMPKGDTISKRPVILYMYGGAFLIGFKEQPPIPYYAQYFTSLGYVFVAFNYRLGFNVTLPGSPERAVYRSVQDLRSAERYLAQRANQFKLDTSRFILMGSSAGCIAGFHSTYMEYNEAAAFSTPIPILDGENLGAVDSVGNNDFGNAYLAPFAIVNQWGALVDTGMIDSDERFPVVSFHGDQDNAVRYEYGYPFSYPVFPSLYGSKPIHERLDHLGILNELHTLVGYGHEPELTDLSLRDTILYYSKEFLYPLLRPVTSGITGVGSICTSTPVVYSVANTQGSAYCWQISGNGSIISNQGHSITVVWNDTGVFTISVVEKNINGASGDLKIYQTHVSPKVHAAFSLTTTELTVTTSNLSVASTNTLWSFGDNTSSTDFSCIKEYLSGGTYTIRLIEDNNVCADTAFSTITIDSCPKANFTSALNNLAGTFNALPTNSNTYFWDFGDGQNANVSSPNVLHFYNQPGQYVVTLIVRNQLNCADTTSVFINFETSGVLEFDENFLIQISSNAIEVTDPNNSKTINMRLLNLSGQTIMNEEFRHSRKFPLNGVAEGLYFLSITDGERNLVKKLHLHPLQ